MSSPIPPAYKTRNWPAYNEALKRRASLTIRFDPGMTLDAAPTAKRGRQPDYSDAAIQTCLTMKVLFGMALRQATGFVESLLRLTGLDWAVPDFSTLSRRQKTLKVNSPYRGSDGPLHLLVDSTVSDQPHLMAELRQLPRPIMRPGTGFHADQARDQAREEQQQLRPPDLAPDHNRALRIDAVNLEHVPSQIGTDRGTPLHGWLPAWVSVTAPNVAHGDAGSGSHPLHQWRLHWLTPDRQTAEIRIRVALINRVNALGTAEIETRDQRPFGLADFVPMLAQGPWATPERIYQQVRSVARPGPLADDFSILSVTFA